MVIFREESYRDPIGLKGFVGLDLVAVAAPIDDYLEITLYVNGSISIVKSSLDSIES